MKHNIAILGLPRSGKTTKAKEFFMRFGGYSIFINTQNEKYFDDVPGLVKLFKFTDYRMQSKRVLIEVMNDADLIPFIEKLFKTQQKSKVMQPVRIIVDEIWRYQDYGLETLKKLVVDGLRWNIQTVITAHTPTMVHPHIYKNVSIYYFFRMNNALYDYFKTTWRIDLFTYSNYLNTPYNYILYDGSDFYKKTSDFHALKKRTVNE